MAKIFPTTLMWMGLVLGACPGAVMAQNAAPVVSNLNVMLDTVNQMATFNFDLADAETDPLDVWLRISGDGGRTWQIPVDSVAGDVGYPITPGTGKTVVWHYDLNALSTLLGNGVYNFRARITADDRVPIDIQMIVDAMDSARMIGNLDFVEGTRHRSAHPVHHAEVVDSMRAIRDGLGLQDWDGTFTFIGFTGTNVISRKAGLWDDANTYYVTAHYDSEINTPGVDDNGSGTIGVLESMYATAGYSFRNSIKYAAFDMEEDGLVGSYEHVNNDIQGWETVGGVLNMEMIAYRDTNPNSQDVPLGFNIFFPDVYNAVAADSFRGNFLTNVANGDSEWLMRQFDTCAALYVPNLRVISIATPGAGIVTPDLRRSDHAAFWDAGHPALMLTDGANLRNPNYHQPSDSMSTIDSAFFLLSARAVLATLVTLAEPIHAGSAEGADFQLSLPIGRPMAFPAHRVQIVPNPNDGQCRIMLDLPNAGRLKIEVLDAAGARITSLFEGKAGPGRKELEWDGRGAPSGTYYVVIDFDGARAVVKDIVKK